jgi:hypothetical protein
VLSVFRAHRGLPVAIGAALAMAAAGLTPASGATPASPSFVQQVSAHKGSVSSLSVTLASPVAAGDRLVVEVGVWNNTGGTASSVTDSAGNTYTELTHFKASDKTELSVWTAPVASGGGTQPTITVRTTSTADIGVAALEYSGVSTAGDASVVDVSSHASGTTTTAATVSSSATPATGGGNELALGFYEDSGFGDTLTGGAGFTSRVNVSPTPDMEFVAEDQVVGAGATPAATVGTGPKTTWLMATLVLQHA